MECQFVPNWTGNDLITPTVSCWNRNCAVARTLCKNPSRLLLARACLLWSMDVAETSQKSLQVNQFAIRIWRGSSSTQRCTPLRKEALDDHKLCFCPTWAALRSAHHCTPFSRRIERVLESVRKYRARTESIIYFTVQSMPLTHRRSVQPVLDAASHRVESTACAHGACSSLVFFQTQVEMF